MQNLQNNKVVIVTSPGAIVDNASPVTNVIDTAGFHELAVYVILGSIDVPVTALKLQTSDQQGTGYTDLLGSDFTGNFPDANADNTVVGFFVDLRGKQRFVDLVLTCGDGAQGTYVTVIAILSKASQVPSTAAKRGLTKQVIL